MEKKSKKIPMTRGKCLKLCRILKLYALILIFTVSGLQAGVNAQQVKLNVDYKNVSLQTIVKDLQKRTDLAYFYSRADLVNFKDISFKIDNATIKQILDRALTGTNLKYKFSPKLVIIKKDDNKKQNKISGKVTDEKGNPLAGVTVVIKGTKVGVATDTKGKFIISGEKNDVLIVSFIGMVTKEYKYTGQKNIVIKLEEDTKQLSEVVVTGYEVIEKRKLTSSVETVKGKDVLEAGAVSIDNMLQGKIAGVSVLNQSSTPGVAPKIRIRGSSSITGNREPVWVVDGVMLTDPVPLKTEDLNSMDKVNLIGNAISFINPEDIETINILKDASATAIYGVKAANGVIVITTKKGKVGAPQISYSTSFSFMQRPGYDKLFRMNSKDRIEVSEEMHRKGLRFVTFQPSRVAYEGALMDLWDKKINYSEFNERVAQLKSNNTDWFDELFNSTVNTKHNLTISGGSEKTRYYCSLGYSNNDGVSKDVNYKKYNAMLKLNMKLKKNFSLGISLSASSTESNRPHSSLDLFKYAYETSRAIPSHNADGSYFYYANKESYVHSSFGGKTYDPIEFNIFHELDNTGSKRINERISSTISINWKLNKYFSYNSVFNISKSNSKGESWANAKSYYAQCKRGLPYGVDPIKSDEEDFYENGNELPFGGELNSSNMSSISYSLRNAFRFYKQFDKSSISSNIGTEIRSNKYDGVTAVYLGYLPERGKTFAEVSTSKYGKFAQVLAGSAPRVTDRETNVLSYYATLTYAYDNRYILNYNIRADGSNKFGQDKDNRFLPVWSVSGRWNIMSERWFENLMWLNSFAVRASYGVQGNVSEDQVPNLILRMGKLDKIAQEYKSTLDKVPNDKLKWEKTTSYNLGLDFALFNNRISGSVNLYKKEGKDQIISKEITTTNGATRVSINEGMIDNKGWELSLNTRIIDTKNLAWGLNFNTSKNYNNIKQAGGTESLTYKSYIDGSVVLNGAAVNSFYSYKFDKLDENGYPTFKDYNETDEEGNYLIHSQQEAFDRIFILSGCRIPDLTGGFSTSIRYKRLSLSSSFSFSVGSKMRLNSLYKDGGQELPFPQQNMSSDFSDRWKKPGDENHTVIPVLSADPLTNSHASIRKYPISNNMWEMYNNSDLRVVSGDFLRCRSLSLSYAFAKKLYKKLNVKGMRASFNMGNVFVVKDSKLKGRDPEQVSLGSGTVPPQRTYSLSLGVTF